MTGACGFTADVDDVSAGGEHGFRMAECCVNAAVQAAVGEGVRGGVQNAHDGALGGEVPQAVSELPLPHNADDLSAEWCSSQDKCDGVCVRARARVRNCG